MSDSSQPLSIDAACLRRLRAQAIRLSRCSAEIDDLVQDVLVAAVLAGRSDAAWLAGTLRRQAAFTARGAGRRRQRERETGVSLHLQMPAAHMELPRLPPMPPAARRVARLALHGLSADEIARAFLVDGTTIARRIAARGSSGSHR